MIQNPVLLVIVLIAIEALVIVLSQYRRAKRFFTVVPAVFWIYFLPMVLSTAHVLPSEHFIYSKISTYGLPVALILLLLGVDLPAIAKLGKEALLTMFAGSLGIVIGAPIVLKLFQPWLPENAWMGFGALSGSWVGGSANMIAVKEAIGAPESVFLPMITVDVVVAYSWMGFLIWAAAYQSKFDRWNHSRADLLHDLKQKSASNVILRRQPKDLRFFGLRPQNDILALAVGFFGMMACVLLARQLPEVKGISKTTWSILIASTLGLGLSFTKLRKLESKGASKLGYWALYLVLASIGVKANLGALASAPVLILAGFVWVLIHMIALLIAGRILRAPMCLLATASQANIGGPISAPIVASVYHPSLAPVGLLLGILGNIVGTYFGLLCSQLCYWVH